MPKERIILDKDLLYHLYVEEERSCQYIARRCKCNKKTVYRKLLRYGISIRLNVSRKRRKLSNQERLNISKAARKGPLSPRWKGGITPENKKARFSVEYKLWRENVFRRDNWTCVFCKKRGGEIQADHIKEFALFPNDRYNIENGRTLCTECHRWVTSQQVAQRKKKLEYQFCVNSPHL